MRALFISSNRLGDAVLSTAVLDRMAKHNPEVRWTVACGPVAVPLFEAAPFVERVVSWSKSKGGGHWVRLWRSVVGTRWTRVVDLRGSALSWFLRAEERQVYRTPTDDAHRLEQMAAALGLAVPLYPALWIGAAAQRRAAEIVAGDDRPILAVAPTANWPPKAWPADRFIALVERLCATGARLEGARVLVAGGPGERDLAAPVLDAVPDDRRIDLVGTEPLMVLAACLAHARLTVANDSGLMHLAAAAGCPTLGLFGPSDDRHYAPRGPLTAWVRSAQRADLLLARSGEVGRTPGALMGGLAVDEVDVAARELLARSSK
jgi:ADP-heptose:LPS heptosyltransferase